MTAAAVCPQCAKSIPLPDDSVGRRVRCGACGTVSRIQEAGTGISLAPEVQPADPAPPSPRCTQCGHEMPADDRFCAACGAPRQVGRPAVVVTRSVGGPERGRIGRSMRRRRRRQVLSASNWILVVGVLYAVFGTIFGFKAKMDADGARVLLSERDADEILVVEGTEYTVAELRERLGTEVVSVFLVNYVLAGIMLGLFIWARRSPLPAMISALCVFLVVQVVSAIVDPITIVQGILIKVLVVAALVTGIRSALFEQRATAARDERPQAT